MPSETEAGRLRLFPAYMWAAVSNDEYGDSFNLFDTEDKARLFLGKLPGEVVPVKVMAEHPSRDYHAAASDPPVPRGPIANPDRQARTAPVAEGQSPPTFVTNAEHAEAVGLLKLARPLLDAAAAIAGLDPYSETKRKVKHLCARIDALLSRFVSTPQDTAVGVATLIANECVEDGDRFNEVHCRTLVAHALRTALQSERSRAERLQAEVDRLRGGKFSDRDYGALKSRLTAAESERDRLKDRLDSIAAYGVENASDLLDMIRDRNQSRDALAAMREPSEEMVERVARAVATSLGWGADSHWKIYVEHARVILAVLSAATGQGGEKATGGESAFGIAVAAELAHAYRKHGRDPWGRHEFYAVLREEVDELWDAIRRDEPIENVLKETMQIACVCQRYAETGDRYRGPHPAIAARSPSGAGEAR